MSEYKLLWQQAIGDSEHPLHQAAWLLFGAKMNLKYADRVLSPLREDVLTLIHHILDYPDLYMESGFGNGQGPIHAVEIIGHWQVTDAVPDLLNILDEFEWDDLVHDKAILALENMPASIMPELIAWADKRDNDSKITIVSILKYIAKGDTQAFDWSARVFADTTNDHDIVFMAENLLSLDGERAIPVLEARINQRKFDREVREHIQDYIADYRAGNWL